MRCRAHASGLALVSLIAALGSLPACGPSHVEGPAQPPVSGDPGLTTVLLAGEPPAGYRSRDDGNRLGDTPARADDYSRLDAQLASETTGTPHINDVARRVRYNSAYFEIDVEVNGERGIVPVTWDMLRAHTSLVSQAYYARVYTSRGWVDGRQVPGFGPDVILPEAFTPELTPVIFEYFKRAFVSWSRDFDGWTQEMADAWLKAAAIHVARVWTPQYVGGVAVASARASQITGQAALGAAAVPNAAAAARACAGGRCPPAVSRAALPRSAPSPGHPAQAASSASTKPSSSNAVPRAAANTARERPGVGAMRRIIYEPAPYHGRAGNAVKSKAPKNGQDALDNSLQVTENSPRRIGIDPETKEFVIFDRTSQGTFHGHVRTWDELRPVDRAFLRKEFNVNKNGKVPNVF